MRLFLINVDFISDSLRCFTVMIDILLISPPYKGLVREPIGLYYLAGELNRNGISVNILDLNVIKMNKMAFHEYLKKINPKIVGLTSFTFNYSMANQILIEVKKSNENIKTVLGGVHASAYYKEIISKNKLIDYIIVGEGELSFLDLCRNIIQNSSPQSVKGIVYWENEVRRNLSGNLITDLKDLPIPNRDLLNHTVYPVGLVQTSRGCPYTCIFCNICIASDHKIRFRPVESVAVECEKLVKQYKKEMIFFFGDNFTYDSDWLNDFCQEIKRRDLNFKWACETRVDKIDQTMLKMMRNTGCVQVQFGIEYGDEKILKSIGKYMSLENASENIAKAKREGLFVESFFIFNCPGENEETMESTFNFIQKTPIDALEINLLTPYPGTMLWNNPERYGMKIIDYNFDNYTTKKYVMENRFFPKRKFVGAFRKILKRLNLVPISGYTPEIFDFLESEKRQSVFQ